MILYIIFKERFNPKGIYQKFKAYGKIKELNLFDEEFYLNKYPQIKNSKLSSLDHYIYHGYKEGKRPSNKFDVKFYLKKYPDVKKSRINPLIHYALYGYKENRIFKKQDYSLIIKDMHKKLKEHEEILDSTNELLDLIYSNCEIKAKGLLRNIQLLSLELLIFLDKVCQKHGLKYWLDYGTLLGAVRNQGFIQWDDDIDIGMMREDYEKLLEILPMEISKIDSLDSKFKVSHYRYPENWLNYWAPTLFLQVIFHKPLTHFDVFPRDFCPNIQNPIEFQNKHKNFRQNLRNNIKKGVYSPIEGLEIENKKLNISNEKNNYITDGLDAVGSKIYEFSTIFPLQEIKFEGYEFPCPNNIKKYLTILYGENFIHIPQKIQEHNRQGFVKKQFSDSADLNKMYAELIQYWKNINNSM